MKKTYISPVLITVQLNTSNTILSTSDVVLNNDAENALGSSEILTKEQTISSSNIWDDEW